jgi:purine-binding chemotaxis protein CheW
MNREFNWQGVRARLAAADHALETALQASPEKIAAVLRERSLRLAKTPPSQSGLPIESVLVFQVGGERYSIAIDQVAEVVPLQVLTPVPGLPSHIKGIINVRTEIWPVISLRALLGMQTDGNLAKGYVLLLRKQKPALGLHVDSIEGVSAFTRAESQVTETSRYVSCRTELTGMLLSVDMVVAALEGVS